MESEKIAQAIQEYEALVAGYTRELKGKLEKKEANIDMIETMMMNALETTRRIIGGLTEQLLEEESKKKSRNTAKNVEGK